MSMASLIFFLNTSLGFYLTVYIEGIVYKHYHVSRHGTIIIFSSFTYIMIPTYEIDKLRVGVISIIQTFLWRRLWPCLTYLYNKLYIYLCYKYVNVIVLNTSSLSHYIRLLKSFGFKVMLDFIFIHTKKTVFLWHSVKSNIYFIRLIIRMHSEFLVAFLEIKLRRDDCCRNWHHTLTGGIQRVTYVRNRWTN